MTITAKVILDSIAPNGARLTTFELTYPRFIHAELMTHRVFSRNAASSRAIPTPKKIERIRQDCAKPSEWGVNQKGMQAAGPLSQAQADLAEKTWMAACNTALLFGEGLCGIRCAACTKILSKYADFCECGAAKLDLHKQVANRILEPFDHITVVLSATKLRNHFKLRLEIDEITKRPLPDPTYFELATKWKAAFDASIPRLTQPGDWHLPYVYLQDGSISKEDADLIHAYVEVNGGGDARERVKIAKMVSAARCARVSYMRQGQGDIQENKVLHDRLTKGGHWAPLEHVATPMGGIEFCEFEDHYDSCYWCGTGMNKGAKGVLMEHNLKEKDGSTHILICMKCAQGHIHSGNFHGWHQYRKEFEGEAGGD